MLRALFKTKAEKSAFSCEGCVYRGVNGCRVYSINLHNVDCTKERIIFTKGVGKKAVTILGRYLNL